MGKEIQAPAVCSRQAMATEEHINIACLDEEELATQ
jgi:hypothetical protein